jgi:hypothetical protein
MSGMSAFRSERAAGRATARVDVVPITDLRRGCPPWSGRVAGTGAHDHADPTGRRTRRRPPYADSSSAKHF